jgi:hypothetical protein
MYFHSDQCYVERPIKATTLYAIELPRQGGNTLFANMYLAYETLPADVQRQIAGLKAMNVYDWRWIGQPSPWRMTVIISPWVSIEPKPKREFPRLCRGGSNSSLLYGDYNLNPFLVSVELVPMLVPQHLPGGIVELVGGEQHQSAIVFAEMDPICHADERVGEHSGVRGGCQGPRGAAKSSGVAGEIYEHAAV